MLATITETTRSPLTAALLVFAVAACSGDSDGDGPDTTTDVVDDSGGDVGLDTVDDPIDDPMDGVDEAVDDPIDDATDGVDETVDDVVDDVPVDVVDEEVSDVVDEEVTDVVDQETSDVDDDTPGDAAEDLGPTCDLTCGDCEVCELVDDVATCVSTCLGCETCDTTGEEPMCMDTCDEDFVCAPGGCVRAGAHAGLDELAGPFADGPAVTAACLECHEDEATAFMGTAHWTWLGETPGLVGHEEGADVGKRNLINNFCVAVPSNEQRCAQCHASYGYTDSEFDFDDESNIDCLVCHADPTSGYARGTTTAGPAAGVDLTLAAHSVGPTSVSNCGSCHFFAGGGDNVKIGDMGSALASATPEIDVHLGAGMTCSSCHSPEVAEDAEYDHTLLGSGVHVPVSEGPLDCASVGCHDAAPHSNDGLNDHALDLACQTCHIPAFSRTQPTKMFWDWSTSGNRTIGDNGVATETIAEGVTVTSYDFKKGDFEWEIDVTPTYAWYDGRAMRLTIEDTFPEGEGSEENPVDLGSPVATYDDAAALIFPFKVMEGVQPGHPTDRYMIVPDLFGPGGFWGGVPSADDFTPEALQALWTNALTQGARIAGQIGEDESFAEDEWGWLHSTMHLTINHEVAPADDALGCSDCHGDSGVMDWAALGYDCDPGDDPVACGSRHYTPD